MFGREFDIEHTEANLMGLHIAKVIDNMDPLALERIRVRILGIHDWENEDEENSIWCDHIAPSKSGSGEIPDIDDFVYVMFLDIHNPMSACWLGWVRHGN